MYVFSCLYIFGISQVPVISKEFYNASQGRAYQLKSSFKCILQMSDNNLQLQYPSIDGNKLLEDFKMDFIFSYI